MKKIFFFMAAMCCTLTAYAKYQPQPDSIITEDLSYGTKEKTKYIYNGQDLPIVEIQQTKQGTSPWKNYVKYEYSYDANGVKTSHIYNVWNEELQVWMASSKCEYTYLSSGKISEQMYYDWNEGGFWDYSSKSEFFYDDHGNEIEELLQRRSGDTWVNYMRFTHTYDENNNQTSFSFETSDGNGWNHFLRYEYTYENNLLKTQINLYWQTNVSPAQYINTGKYEYTYDEHGNRITEVNFTWESSIGAWVKTGQTTYTYDEDNHPILELGFSWNKETSTWEESSKTERVFAPEGVLLTRTEYIFNADIHQYYIYKKETRHYSNLPSQCPAPKNLRVANLTSSYALIQWEPGIEGQTDFVISAISPSDYFYEEDLTATSYLLENLTPGETYQVEVEGDCGEGYSDWAEITFTTPWPEALDDVQPDKLQGTKLLRDGQLFILVGDKTYDAQGAEVR